MKRYRSILMAVAAMIMIVPVAWAQTPDVGSSQTSATGTALDILPAGDSDTVSVVSYGVGSIGDFWMIVRNNTDGMVSDVEIKVTVRDGDGKLVAVGDLSEVRIANLDNGEVAVGRVGGTELDRPLDGLEVSFDVVWDVGESDSWNPAYNLEFIGSDWPGDRLLGEFVNPSNVLISDVFLAYACIDVEGSITSAGWGSAHGKLSPGESTAFQINSVSGCETYLISGFGYGD